MDKPEIPSKELLELWDINSVDSTRYAELEEAADTMAYEEAVEYLKKDNPELPN